MTGIARTLGAFSLGALAVCALPPFSTPVVLPIAFGGLYLITVGESRKRAGLAGWMFGVGFFLFGLSWIAESFFVDAERFGWMAVPAVAGLSAGLALFPAAAMAAFASSKAHGVPGALIFAVCWSVSEWLRGTVLTGFPWNLIGYAWADYDIPRQMAAWVGSYGLGLLTVLLSVLPVTLLAQDRRQNVSAIFLFTAVAAGVGAFGMVRLAERPLPTDTTVRIVQGNIPQREKWAPAFRARNIARYLDLSAQPGGFDLLLWPESAFPGYIDEDVTMLDRIADLLPEGSILLTGAQTRAPDGNGTSYRNSVLAIDSNGRIVARYAKHHLVPFGEYVPFRSLLPLDRLTAGLGDFTPGPGPDTLDLPGLPPVGLSICYEAIFPGRVVDAADRPGWLFNATNDAWFGASLGPRQHLASARMRAVEEGLPMVRAANTGISAVIDGFGRIVSRLEMDETGVLDTPLPAALPPTPFSKYGQMTFLLILAACLASAIGLNFRKDNEL
ncbi:apolipoprotein N-acyltransferase [uncultured Sulfitobacter sp.]|uniref:apolipoprotein N-acyltransferase n=1 Tax=uncultured Sulfitobacter sp. TaxID=191468 RepID=UPI0026192F80|nr:apolipoprotein N-acyltransferase [uncultured Sulfitobacter sp.]